MEFGKNLKMLLNEQHISQESLAKSIGFTQRAVSKWVNNQSEPTATAIQRCAEFFHVGADELLGIDHFGGRTYSPAPSTLSAKEKELLEAFRQLLPETQDFIVRTARSLRDGKTEKIGK